MICNKFLVPFYNIASPGFEPGSREPESRILDRYTTGLFYLRKIFIVFRFYGQMAIGVIVFIIVAVIILIWVLVEMKRFRHKFFAWFLIALIILGYISFTFVMTDKDINLNTVSGVLTAGKIYFSWLGSIFGNFKTMTTNAIKMDWSANKTEKVDIDKSLNGE